jgi:YidC/Oxa1 family membrane protein insertase
LSILNPINDLVAWVIMHIYNVLGPIFGATSGLTWVLSIIVLVVAMRLILLPLFIKQMHTQRAMTALTPKITEIRKKYKGDKEKLNQETMKLYQEAGVNPLMGCLPVVLQMPLFFALFSVLRAIAEPKANVKLPYGLSQTFVTNVNKASIFGVQIKDTFLHGTSLHVHVVVAVVVAISMATTYLTVKQSMKRGMMPTGSDSPMGQSQKLMAYVMPLFALTGLYWPFGLVLYWVTTNLWTLGQQWVMLRRYPVGAAAAMAGGNVPMGKSARPATASGFPSMLGRARPSSQVPPSAPAQMQGGPAAGTSDASANGSGSANGNGSANGRAKSVPGGSGQGAGQSTGQAKAAKNGAAGSSANGSGAAKTGGGSGQAAKPGVTSSSSGGGQGGMFRRLGKSRAEPESPASAEPETRIVRQQPQRQSRSKRSGKR